MGQRDRGVGKSILFRKILNDLQEEMGFLLVTVDGRNNRDAEDLIRDLCRTLSDALRSECGDDEAALTEIVHIEEISDLKKITKGWARSVASEIEATTGVKIGFLDFIGIHLGIKAKTSEGEQQGETREREVTPALLRRLLESVRTKVMAEREKEIVIFVDNLDMIHHKDQIAEFVREIYQLRKFPIVTTLRSEAITPEFQRDFRRLIPVVELDKESLLKILKVRINKSCQEREKLMASRFQDVADRLAASIGNPLAFLTWLDHLVNNAELDPDTLLDDLKEYARNRFAVSIEEIEKVARFLLSRNNDCCDREEIVEGTGISDGTFDKLYERGVLVPDDLYDPGKYRLSPDLLFFQLGDLHHQKTS